MNSSLVIAIVIFSLVMIAIVSEKVNRVIASMTGALLMIIFNIVTVESSIEHIDFNTIGILIGMMIFVSVVKNSGLFEYIAIKAAKYAKGDPFKIMIFFTVITAVLSAVLDNVTTVLLIGPMIIVITQILNIDATLFLITQIIASNIGGTATLIGDPPNIMIGSAANLSFMDFVVNLGPIVAIILVTVIFLFKFMFCDKLNVEKEFKNEILKLDENKSIKDMVLLKKSIVMLILVLIGFMLHSVIKLESSIVALSGATIMLFIGKQDVEEILASIEWSSIAFFSGLFIMVGGLIEVGLIDMLASSLINATNGQVVLTMVLILWLSALVSCFLDNIPFVATLIPLLLTMQSQGIDVMPLWWATSLGACLGGNGTLIGASANIVLANVGHRHGYDITFKNYMKIGFPIMILSVLMSMIYLLIRFN